MRIAFFAKHHKRSGITSHMERAMRSLGHDVLRVNRRKLERVIGKGLAWKVIRRRVRRFKPDLVLVFTFDLPADLLTELRADAKTATFFDDAPRELTPRIKGAVAASDVFFITSRGQIAQYEEELGATPAYVTGGCDSVDHFRVQPEPSLVSDVAFIGKPDSRGGRVDVVKELSKHYDVQVYGPRWREVGLTPRLDDVYPPQYRQVCNSAKVVLGNDLRDDLELYFSNRTWISLGCGAFLCTRYVPKLEEVLSEDEHCAFFRGTDDAVEVIGRYLKDDAARARIAASGHAYAHEQYSYARMVERMLAHPQLAPGA